MNPTQVSRAVLGMPAPKPTPSPIANSFLCLPWRRSSTSVRFFWGPFVELGIAAVVVVIVRLEPVLDVVVKDKVIERDEAVVDSDVEEITGIVIADDDDVVVIDEVEPELEEITGIVISDVEEITGTVIFEDGSVLVMGKVVEKAEDMNPEEVDTEGAEVEEITGIVISEDDDVTEDKGADDPIDVLVEFNDDEVSGRDGMVVREELMIGVCLSVVFLVPDE